MGELRPGNLKVFPLRYMGVSGKSFGILKELESYYSNCSILNRELLKENVVNTNLSEREGSYTVFALSRF